MQQWPSNNTFAADGHKRLHAARIRYGGPERWAAELGVPLIAARPASQLDESGSRDQG